jgi:hypothetical protein
VKKVYSFGGWMIYQVSNGHYVARKGFKWMAEHNTLGEIKQTINGLKK